MASCSTRHPGRENADSPSVAAIFSFLIGTSALTGLSLEQRACSRTGADHQVSGSTQALERWPGGRRWGLGLPVTGGVLQGPPCPPSSGHTPGPGGLTVTPPRAPPPLLIPIAPLRKQPMGACAYTPRVHTQVDVHVYAHSHTYLHTQAHTHARTHSLTATEGPRLAAWLLHGHERGAGVQAPVKVLLGPQSFQGWRQ